MIVKHAILNKLADCSKNGRYFFQSKSSADMAGRAAIWTIDGEKTAGERVARRSVTF
jgi:hypothetical protein